MTLPSLLLMASMVTNMPNAHTLALKPLNEGMLINTNYLHEIDVSKRSAIDIYPTGTKFRFNGTDYMTSKTLHTKTGWISVDVNDIKIEDAGTNMVFHTNLKPVVSKTNDTYYIRFITK